uniref:Uncharacterized protein n=1 Tax=Branchiostoma floridae TaxID=7739 RepID=C3YLX6_BRAFL|eukprot:XP_002602558.1 hypothetical protein BRAFLDRAFT_93863 [Branchiostoma floridae]
MILAGVKRSHLPHKAPHPHLGDSVYLPATDTSGTHCRVGKSPRAPYRPYDNRTRRTPDGEATRGLGKAKTFAKSDLQVRPPDLCRNGPPCQTSGGGRLPELTRPGVTGRCRAFFAYVPLKLKALRPKDPISVEGQPRGLILPGTGSRLGNVGQRWTYKYGRIAGWVEGQLILSMYKPAVRQDYVDPKPFGCAVDSCP